MNPDIILAKRDTTKRKNQEWLARWEPDTRWIMTSAGRCSDERCKPYCRYLHYTFRQLGSQVEGVCARNSDKFQPIGLEADGRLRVRFLNV